MHKPVEEKTVDELLLDAYKAQVSTYVRLLEVKDAQVAFLEAQIKGLKLELEQYKNTEVKPIDSTGLTTKEREEIAKLSKEIMDEEPRERIEVFVGGKSLGYMFVDNLGIKLGSKENTTTANSDVKENKGISLNDYLDSIKYEV